MEENTGKITLAKTITLVENKILEFPLYVTAKDGKSEHYLSQCTAFGTGINILTIYMVG